jgi:hypothetical protein
MEWLLIGLCFFGCAFVTLRMAAGIWRLSHPAPELIGKVDGDTVEYWVAKIFFQMIVSFALAGLGVYLIFN